MIYKFLIGLLIGLSLAWLIINLRNRAIERAIKQTSMNDDPSPIKYWGQNLFNFIVKLIHLLKL